jgi:nitrite reductase (NO-forming)
MGYFNVTNPSVNGIDGKDVAITKSINMVDWQANLTKTIQKANPNGTVTTSVVHPRGNNHGMMMNPERLQEQSSNASFVNNSRTNEVTIVKKAATLGDKSFSPNPVITNSGSTITWTNTDNIVHTVTSGEPNSVNAGELFDSGLTALIMPSKSFSHKFIHPGEFSYFCRVHPTMIGEVHVLP